MISSCTLARMINSLWTRCLGTRLDAPQESSWIQETVSLTLSQSMRVLLFPMPFSVLILLEGTEPGQNQWTFFSYQAGDKPKVLTILTGFSIVVAIRDVTEHLQLLLRKAGYHFHTTAEKEIVRIIKEKTCYLPLFPAKEEKDAGGKNEDFMLPDGNVIKVSPNSPLDIYIYISTTWVSNQTSIRLSNVISWVLKDSAHPRFCSTPRSLVRSSPVFTRLLWTRSAAQTWTCASRSTPTLFSREARLCARALVIVCCSRSRSLPSRTSRSRSQPPQSVNTVPGSEALSLHLFLHSRR